MKKTIFEKIWEKHLIEKRNGYPDVLAIDLQLIHEVTSPQAFEELRSRGLDLYDRGRCVATVDHNVPTGLDRKIITDPISRNQVETLRKNCEEFGVKIFDMDSRKQGIVHVIGPELGLTQPGMTIVCGDSHTSTHGAFGALAFGVGTTEVGHVMATGALLQGKPKKMKVEFKGKRSLGISAKDIVLKMISEIGVSGGTGYVIEYCGEVIADLSMEERMTICNMSIECGSRAGIMAPDEVTYEYLKGRSGVEDFDEAVKSWKGFVSDPGCEYDKEVVVNISEMGPMVTWGINPGEAIDVVEVIPEDSEERALEYVGLERGQRIEGVGIDYVFIGSCTNGRISDLREAAKIFRDRKVADGVRVFVVPGSERVQEMAITEGLDQVFIDAGCEFRNPGCSMCLAMNGDSVPDGKRCASTSNRNFMGRQGKGSITHLMSPAMAAAAAIEGKIIDVRKI